MYITSKTKALLPDTSETDRFSRVGTVDLIANWSVSTAQCWQLNLSRSQFVSHQPDGIQ